MISINVLLTTIGREDLRAKMLPSLVNELNENDYLTIVSDMNHEFVSDCISQFAFKCSVSHIKNETQLGFWGHESRNQHQNNLLGDFITNADDDDRYVSGAFDVIRQTIKDKNKVYLFRVQENDFLSWVTYGIIKIGEIGTPCGVIPNTKNLPKWGHFIGGDGHFYETLSKQMDYEFIDYIIYKVRDTK